MFVTANVFAWNGQICSWVIVNLKNINLMKLLAS